MVHRRILLVAAMVATTAVAQFAESEPNNTKSTATAVAAIADGETIVGLTTGSSTSSTGNATADYFRVTPAALPPGIWCHRLALASTTTAVPSGTIRGRSQSNGSISAGSDVQVQTSVLGTVPPRMNQWYGFGGSEEIVYRVTGSSTTTAPYTVTHTVQPIVPTDLGILVAGPITISTVGFGHATDTEVWVYDAAYQALPGGGNDDAPTPSTAQGAHLVRNLPPGRYYLAVSNFNLANASASPPDDRFRNGIVLDAPGAITVSSTSINLDCGFGISDACGTRNVSATKTAAYEILWFSLELRPAAQNLARFEGNDGEATLTLDGIVPVGDAPVEVTKAPGSLTLIRLCSTNVGLPFDFGVMSAPPRTPPSGCDAGTGGLRTPNGQVLHVDLHDPSFEAQYGLAFQNAFPNPGTCGAYEIPYLRSSPLPVATGQMMIVSPSNAEGIALSAAAVLHVIPFQPLATPVVVAGDDAALTLPVGALPFYQTGYTQVAVETNGRILFGGGSPNPSPTLTGFLGGAPSVGCWADLDTSGTGIEISTVSSPTPNLLSFAFFGRHAGTGIPVNFQIEIDAASGEISLAGLQGLGSAGLPMLLGLSRGEGRATDPGPAAFGAGLSGVPTLASDALYRFGPTGPALTNGVTRLRFLPLFSGPAQGGYSWVSP